MKFIKLLSLSLFFLFVFQSAKSQTVTVVTPNGGEVLYACQSYNITWSQTGSPSNYWNIDYSSNGGTTWTSVASNLLVSTGTFAWTVPNLQSSTVIMRIMDAVNNAVTDQSNSNFTINIPITVTVPNGSESWLAGTSQNITWNAVGTSGVFDIYYSINGGSSWNTIAYNYTTGAGTYAWTIPNNPSAFCLVRVQDHTTGCMIDNSNNNFTIVAATPILITPNVAATMYMNCVYTITWNTSTFYSPVKLEYSTNSGSTWVTIVSSTSNSGAYSWTVPSTASSSCLVRASNTADLTSLDVSNAVFTIAPSVTIVSPNGTETLTGCSNYTITWNKTNCLGNWNIAYSADNGSTWNYIVYNLTNTGTNSQTYVWYVPNNISTTQALIRVESYNSPGTYFDASNSVFNINPNNNIAVTAPNGSETWVGCSSYTISWTKLSSPCNTYFNLYYSLNNGTSYNLITSVNDNGLTSQSYSWSIPNTLTSTQCLVKVVSGNWPTVFDVSNAMFTITPSADVTVVSPNGGEVWQGLTSHTITWSNLSGASGLYNVEYSTNSGSNWTTLATNISGNSYNWVSVPNTPSTTCLVRVTDYINPCKYDVSNAVFTISPATPIMTAPNGGQTFNVGCTAIITWNPATYYSTIDLFYSSNGGISYTAIASSLTNNGYYTWTVPNAASANCLIKVANSADNAVFDISDAPFTISVPLTVTAANGGETWIGCSTYNITWTKSTCLGNWNIYYSINNGTAWTLIANYVTNTGSASQSYAWQVPNGITTTQALIKVESYNNPSTYSDVSDAVFNINPSNDITVTAPNGGQTLTALTTYAVTWTNLPSASGQYTLQYSTNNGTSYSTIVSNITGNTYSWTVPNTSSSQCLIKVIDYVNPCKFDVSDAVFTINPAGPVLLSPNGGETVYIGCTASITWAAATFISTVKLEYSTNNGSTWTLITSGTSNTGSYSWTVPNTVSANCIIKASNTSNLTLFDVSDAVFAIAPAITVTAPNGGETLTGCSNYIISWNKSTCLGNWNLEYSKDNGVSWNTIASNITNTGANTQTYTWYVPNSITTTLGLIRVSSYLSPGTYYDVSNAVFNINPNNNITVVTANGGEVWAGCSSYNITWSKLTSPCNTSFDLYYSLNNGSTYTYFASAADNGLTSQSYSWSIPNTLSSNQCLIKVASGNFPTVFDVSDAVFTINPSVDITVASPNGGEVWQGLSSHTITWTNLQGASGLYNIEYSINNGTSWTTLATNYSGNSYNWSIVPNTPSTTCLVRITDYLTPCKFDVSNAVFTISPATPILTAPNGGQTFNVGCSTSITWNSSTYYSTVTLYYSSNGGTTWTLITTTSNNGSYTWTVPNAASGNCMIKAANSADLTVYDISDAPFTINVPLTVTSANGGESWVGCSSYNITWTKTTCIGNWNIYYSIDNGANWVGIATNVTNTGVASQSYSWSVPNTITTTQALIKVESYTSPSTYFDVSDAVFTINPSHDVTVITPNGGETIASLINYNITWSNLPAASGQYSLYYSTNNGGSWNSIVSNVTGNSYIWSVPNLSSTQCLIKVMDYVNTCKYDVSNAVFTITPPTPILLTPNGGETLYIGCNFNITWNTTTFISSVNLDYSTNGGITWLPIVSGTANDGVYAWTIPNTQSQNCRVRASNSIDVSIFDISDASFIISPSVQVLTPNGGETLTGCSNYNITWNKTTCIGNWNIEYSLNNGVSWTTIVSNLSNSGPNFQTYIWYVPNNLTTTQGLIRVSSYSSPSTYWDQSNAVFSINPNNNIVLSTPNGGEVWTGCQTYNITWSKLSSPCNTSYDLYYSLNNGGTYTYFANAADNGLASQTYAWTVPNTISSTQALIKVVSASWPTIFDVSNAVFTINKNIDITVTSPDGGEVWQGLSTHTITWNNSIYASGLYTIYYSTNGGSSWNTIVTNLPGNSYNWSVPNTPSTTCLIKVEDYLAVCRYDNSNANFTISPATPILLTPNGAEVLNSGQTYNITWTAATYFSSVNLYYSSDNGITWNAITTNISNNGSYSWTVPNVNSTTCLVKAANNADVTVFDVSDAVFTIKPAVKIVTPNGGESVGGCTVTSITWERSPTWSTYKIEYSTNNGTSWTTITSSYAASSNPATYIWTLPNLASTQTLVRVTPTLATSYYDVSDNVFTITHPVTIIQPNFGGTMVVGTTYNITWNSDGISNLYDIYYSTNGGANYTNIVTAYNTSTNVYAWTVPNTPSTNCKIWVKDNTASCKQDTSDVVFTISLTAAPITLLTPNGGDSLSGCFPYNITWVESPTIGTYDLLYSTNSGSTWNNIVTGYATSSHSYSWNIPNTINSGTCLVRVRSNSNPTIFDQSDALLDIHYGNLTALPSDTTVCSGQPVQLNARNGHNYTWTPSTGLSCTTCANPIATPLASTTYTVTSNNAGCILTDTARISVFTASVAITASPASSICAGTTVTFTAAPINGGTTPAYQWYLNGSPVGSNSPTYSNSSLTNGSQVYVVLTSNAPCLITNTATSSTITMNVISIPAVPGTISGTATVCSGSTNTYSIGAVSGATGYVWSLPGGWTGTSTTTSITATAGVTAGNISVTAGNTCGPSSPQTLAVAVNVIPATPGPISGLAVICSGTSNTYSITAVSGASSYTWVLPNGWTGTSTTNSITAAASAAGGNITVTANNGCGNSSVQTLAITVNTPPATPGTISGTTPICAGSTNTYSITAVSGAVSYTWALPGGWTGTSTTASISAAANTASGNVTVTADNGCGSSAVKTLAVVVNSIPAVPGTISGSVAACQGTSNTYSVIAVSGAASYTWILPSGWTGTSATNSITAIAGSTGGSITVTADNGCGNSSLQTLAVTVNPLPVITAGTAATICAGQMTPLTSDGGNTYSWLPATGLSDPTISNPNASPVTPTTYTVTGTSLLLCSSTATVTITVTPGPTITHSANTAICNGSSTQLTAGGATTYSWLPVTDLSNASISNPMAHPTATTTYTVTGTTGLCSGTATITVTVNQIPAVTAGTAATICSGTATPLTAGGAVSYSWLPTTGLSNPLIANPSASPVSSTSYTVTGTTSNCSATATVAVAVTTLTVSAGGDVSICSGGNTTLSASGGTAYSWLPATGLSAANISNPIASPTGTTTYTVTVTSGSCSATDDVIVTVNSVSSASAGPDVSIPCGGSATLAASGGTAYSWLPVTGLSNPNIANPIATPPYTITYTVTVSNGTCSATDQVTVTAGSFTANAGNDVSICTGGTTTLTGSSSTPPWVNLATSYSFAENTGSFTYITGGTVVLNGASTSMDDVISGPFTMPSFMFNNIAYTSVYISTNGFITFGSQPTTTNYDPIGSLETYAGAVAGFGTDLNKATAGTPEIRYQTVGTEFVVQYKDMGRYNSSGTSDRLGFQIRLNTSGNTVKVVYDAPALIGAATFDPEVGLRGSDNTFATNVHNREILSTTGPWVNSLQGTAITSLCFLDSSVPTTKPNAGTTFTWSPATSGTAAYSWSPSAGLSSTTIANPIANPTVTTTYTLTATSGNCSAIDMVTVTVGGSSVNAGTDASICSGGNTTLNATGAATYSWLPITGLSAANIANPIASPTATTSYTVTGTSGSCTSTDIVMITVTTMPTANAGSDISICTGNTTTLNASGGTAYSWLPVTGLSSAAIANPVANPAATTTYTVTVSNGNCSATDMVTVTVTSPPIPNAGADVSICAGSNTLLTASGGTSYSWLPVTGLSSPSIASPAASPAATTTYTVSVSNGVCSLTDMVIITVNTVPANAGIDAAICNGSSTTLAATGGTTYSWLPITGLSSASIANPVASPTSTTTYTVTVSDGTCSATDMVNIVVASSAPVAPASISGAVSVCAGSSQTYSVAVDPNITSYAWTMPSGWPGTSVTNSITSASVTNSGVVSVIASNACGSASAVTLAVTVNPLPTVTMTSLGTVCKTDPAFTITAGSPSGGNYSGTGVSGTSIFTPLTAGVGTFTITYLYTDVNGCSKSANNTVIVHLCTGISSLTNNDGIPVIVYPNPFSTSTTVHINENIILNGASIMVFDLVGKNVLNITNLHSSDVLIERKDLDAGVYFYQFMNDNHIVSTGKLIIN